MPSIFRGCLSAYKLAISREGCLAGLVLRHVGDESLDVEVGRESVVECCRSYGVVCKIVEKLIEETW